MAFSTPWAVPRSTGREASGSMGRRNLRQALERRGQCEVTCSTVWSGALHWQLVGCLGWNFAE